MTELLQNKSHSENISLYLQTFGIHDDCTFTFNNPLNLEDLRYSDYDISLLKLEMWMTMKNISASISNNVIQFYVGGVLQPPLILPDGNYTLDLINERLDDYFLVNGITSNYIQFIGDFATNTVKVLLKVGARVDFSNATNLPLGVFLGLPVLNMNNTAGVNPALFYGTSEPKFNYFLNGDGQVLKIDTINVHCDAIASGGVYSNNATQTSVNLNNHGTIHKFIINALPNTLQNELVAIENTIHMRNFGGQINTIRFRLTNQDSQNIYNMITKPINYLIRIIKN